MINIQSEFLEKNKKKETISGLKQKLYKMSLEHLTVPESKEVFKHTHTHTHNDERMLKMSKGHKN